MKNGQTSVSTNSGYVDTKKLYLYLCLRKTDRVKNFLKHFPHYSTLFMSFYKMFNAFTKELHEAYLKKYVLRESLEMSSKYIPHMERLHRNYLETCGKRKVHMSVVKKYLKAMEPRELLFHLCYAHSA